MKHTYVIVFGCIWLESFSVVPYQAGNSSLLVAIGTRVYLGVCSCIRLKIDRIGSYLAHSWLNLACNGSRQACMWVYLDGTGLYLIVFSRETYICDRIWMYLA